MNNPRYVAYKILNNVLYEGGYSNIAINKALRNSPMNNQDRGFMTELVYGTIEQKLFLEYVLQKFSKNPIKDLSKPVVLVLIMGLYQLRFMDSVTDFAAVDESVKLCKKVFPKGSGFVNGVLRNVVRDKNAFDIKINNKEKMMSTKFSVSQDIVKLLISQYGEEKTLQMLMQMGEKPEIYLRVNTLKTSKQNLLAELSKEVKAEAVAEEELAIKVKGLKRISENNQYISGMFTVQDLSSMAAVRALDPKPMETILDICASPGGKTTFIGELMENKGVISARDISENKLKLVDQMCQRLGINIVTTQPMDAMVLDTDLVEKFDRVLVDAPCSGLGIIRKKPELRYKTLKEIHPLYPIQKGILNNGAQYVKKGGILVYSTCTINKMENEEQVRQFLANNDFELLKEQSLLFGIGESDGFYIATLRKR